MAMVNVGVATARPSGRAASAQLSPRPAQIDPKAQQLLDRAIQALGGQAFLEAKTLTTHGRAFSIADGATAGFVTFDSWMEYPDKRRLAYGFGKAKPVILVNNGDQAWELDRMGITDQLPEQVRNWKLATYYSLENLLRLHLHDPGTLIQAGGVDFVDNLPVDVIDIFDPRQVHIRLYLDAQTYLPVRIAYRVQNPQSRDWEDYADDYSDYQRIQGIATPMHIMHLVNGRRVAETFRNSAKYNEDYPREYFEPVRVEQGRQR
jgi:hypothetical protein